MEQIKRRIDEIIKSIEVLRDKRERRDFRVLKESEIIITICELQEELEQLQSIVKANRSLFG